MRKALAERLPSYMVPSHIVVLNSFPIAASGKIDRKALPAPEGRSPELDGSYVAPRTPTEEVLASIWREVLNVKRVGVHDNFFELGGHSLLAMQVVARLAKLLKLDLPLQRFFETATVSALAAELQKMLGAGETGDVRSIVPVPRTGNLPLSFAQQRLWFLDRLLPNKAAYNIPRAMAAAGAARCAGFRAQPQSIGGASRDAAHALCSERGRARTSDRAAECGGVADHRSQCDAAGRA